MSAPLQRELSVGEVAQRSGLAVSAIHFYEAKGLIGCLSLAECPLRNPGDELGEQGCGARLLEPAMGQEAT